MQKEILEVNPMKISPKIELEFRIVDFYGGRKTGGPREKNPSDKGENQQTTQLT
jgi:hypothetical protein